MCMRAGIEFRPYMTPNLQHRIIHRVIHDTPVYYGSREIKEQDEDDVYKIAYSRLVGAVFTPGNCMAVYNTRDALMKWNGLSEMKTRLMVEDIAGMNAKVHSVDSAIMFGRSYDDALKMLEAYEKTSRRGKKFDGAYNNVHFIPQTEAGIRQMRLFQLQNWHKQMLNATYEDEMLSHGRGNFDYDAFADGTFYFTAFDCNLVRRFRFKSGAEMYATGTVLSRAVCVPEGVYAEVYHIRPRGYGGPRGIVGYRGSRRGPLN